VVGVVVDGASVGVGVVSSERGRLHGRTFVAMIIDCVTAARWDSVHLSDCSRPLIIHSLVLVTILNIKSHYFNVTKIINKVTLRAVLFHHFFKQHLSWENVDGFSNRIS